VLACDYGHEGGMVVDEHCVMAVVCVSSWRWCVSHVGGGQLMKRGNTCPVPRSRPCRL
jgi:hypothetical protein